MIAKLDIPPQDLSRLSTVFNDYQLAWQHVSDWIFENKTKNRSKVHAATYRIVRDKLPSLNSGLVQQARNDAIAKFSSISSNGHKITAPPKLENVSVRFDNRTSSIKGNLLSLAVGGKRLIATIISFPFLEKHRTYKTLAPLVFKRDGHYWVALTFDIPELPVKPGTITGVDMGLRILAATSEGKLIRGTKMNRLRRKTRFVKSALQRKGTKSAKRHLRRLSRKEQRQSRDVTHCAVNEVLKTNSSILAVEDLDLRARKHRKGSNRRRFSVPISNFVRILEYKAKALGKQVVKVKPHYTSQEDCRGLKPGTRMGGRYVGVDGKVLHADLNAACNIALKAQTLGLDNPVSICYSVADINGQAAVNQPIVGFGSLQASIPLRVDVVDINKEEIEILESLPQ